MFSQTTEYALRVIVFLAAQPDRSWTTHAIAAATHVPEGYLSKVLQSLGRAGLVISQRGLHGGFVLGKPPATITVLEVLDVVDPLKRIKTCPVGIKSHGTHLCPLHQRLDDAIALVEKALGTSTIADLLVEPTPSKPLCEGLTIPPEFLPPPTVRGKKP